MTSRTVIALTTATAALTIGGTLTACARQAWTATPPGTPLGTSSRTEATHYMDSHPTTRPHLGMTAGMVLDSDPVEFGFAAATQAHCPTVMPRRQRGGKKPLCGALTLAILTTSGRTVQAECGSITRRVACQPWLTGVGDQSDDWMNPLPGDYVWFPASGQIHTGTDLRLITWQAIVVLGAENGGSWVTSSASPPAVPPGTPRRSHRNHPVTTTTEGKHHD